MSHELLLNEEVYHRFIQKEVPEARRFVWIATADVKDLHVASGKRFVPFVQVLARLVREGVEVRLIHAKEPGPRFRKDFDQYPEFVESDLFEQVLCPRMHMKVMIIDGVVAMVGSANLTGAGMGAKSPRRRNFEAGYLTREASEIGQLMEFYDRFWIGDYCVPCQRRDVCPGPLA